MNTVKRSSRCESPIPALLVLILIAIIASQHCFAGTECPQIEATIVSKYHLNPTPADLAEADWEALCNSASHPGDEESRVSVPGSMSDYLSLERHPLSLLQACAAKDRQYFRRHALDLALLAAPLELPKVIVDNCHQTGLHLLGADNGVQVQVWAHYFGSDLAHLPRSAGLEYDQKALYCPDQGALARGRDIHPGVNLANCYRRTRADIAVVLKLQGSKDSAQILLLGDRTVHYRYTIEPAGDSAYCVQNGARVAGPAIPLVGAIRQPRRQLIAYCETTYGTTATTGPGKTGHSATQPVTQ